MGLLLKRWSPLFDPRVERYDLLPIWVKLPNLPFEFWSVEFFKLIGNTLGTYLETDLSFLDMGVCCLGKVLVLLDLRNGLAADILIKKGGSEFYQPVDYLGIPFRCNRCHAHSHLIPDCTLPFSKSGKSASVPKSKSFLWVKNPEVLSVEKDIYVPDEVVVEV